MTRSKTNQKPAASSAAIEKFSFHGHDLAVVRTPDGDVGVSLRRVCEAVPVDPDSQAKRLARAAEAGANWARTVVMTVRDERGREQAMIVLPRRSIPMWAATVDISRVLKDVREDARIMLAALQDEAADVLADHYIGPRHATPGLTPEQFMAALAPLAAGFEALAKSVAAQNDRLTALEERARDGAKMSRERVSSFKKRVSACAKDLSSCGVEKGRAASLRIHKRLKMKVGWFGDFCRLDNMPARHEAVIDREMEVIEHETRGSVDASRQLGLPGLRLVANKNSKRASA